MLDSGLSLPMAAVWNFASALTAVLGFFVGIGIGVNDEMRQWLFAVTIGMFLYVSLIDMVATQIHIPVKTTHLKIPQLIQ